MAITIPPGVPAEARWFYYATHYGDYDGCILGMGAYGSSIQGIETTAGRRYYMVGALEHGIASFHPDGIDVNGTHHAGFGVSAADWAREVTDQMAGPPAGDVHPLVPFPTVLGVRSADPTWPGHDAILAWTPGVTGAAGSMQHHIEESVVKWANLLKLSPWSIPVRLWHEQGNGVYSDQPNYTRYKANWRKVVNYWQALGAIGYDALEGKAIVAWCPAAHPANPSSDKASFPGSDVVGVIGRDSYNNPGTSWADVQQQWYDEFNPRNGPSNQHNRPLMVFESGIETGDAQRLAKLQEWGDRLTGNHAQPWDQMTCWVWWNSANNNIVNTPAGFLQQYKNIVNQPYFLPNGVVTEPTGGGGTVTAPVVTSSAATGITSTAATLNGTVDPNNGATTYRAEWGTTIGYGNQTLLQSAGSGDVAVPITIGISGLPSGTVIHWRLIASNSAGAATPTADRTFTTDTVTLTKPIVTQSAVDGVTQTTAVVHGTVNPNGKLTTYHVEYGLTTAYGLVTPNVSAGSGTSAVTATVSLSSLTAGTTYHTRITATNPDGTTVSTDQQFTTAPIVVPPPSSPGVLSMGFVG